MPRERCLARSRIQSARNDVPWIKSDWFCPACGKQDMWQDTSFPGGDYYHESSVTCFSCLHEMCCVDEVKDES